MTDREKVLKGLECCSAMNGGECRKCPYSDECIGIDQPYGTAHLAADALELLKNQEPRVLTLEEVGQTMTVWGELSGRNFETMPLLLDRIEGSKVLFVSRDVNWYLEANKEDYAKSWRCWSAKPTDEQRESVKWES